MKGAAVAMALPKISNLSRTTRKIRHRQQNAPVMPQSLQELKFEGVYSVTNKNDNFVLFDNAADDRLVMFSTNANLEL